MNRAITALLVCFCSWALKTIGTWALNVRRSQRLVVYTQTQENEWCGKGEFRWVGFKDDRYLDSECTTFKEIEVFLKNNQGERKNNGNFEEEFWDLILTNSDKWKKQPYKESDGSDLQRNNDVVLIFGGDIPPRAAKLLEVTEEDFKMLKTLVISTNINKKDEKPKPTFGFSTFDDEGILSFGERQREDIVSTVNNVKEWKDKDRKFEIMLWTDLISQENNNRKSNKWPRKQEGVKAWEKRAENAELGLKDTKDEDKKAVTDAFDKDGPIPYTAERQTDLILLFGGRDTTRTAKLSEVTEEDWDKLSTLVAFTTVKKEEENSNTVLIIIGLLCVIVIAGLSYYFFVHRKKAASERNSGETSVAAK